MSENYIVINGRRTDLTDEQLKQLNIKLKLDKNWRANKSNKYYYVNSSNLVCSTSDMYDYIDDFRYYSHNYFETKKEAEEYVYIREIEMLLYKFADENNKDILWEFGKHIYSLHYNTSNNNVEIYTNIQFKKPKFIYFSSRDIAERAIEEIGEERIKEYLTYEW